MIVFIFAAILALILIFLSFIIIKHRRAKQVVLGDNNDLTIIRAVRAHSNFLEYTPFFLLLLFFLELGGAREIEIIALGTIFTLGRISHAYSLIKAEKYKNNKLTETPKFRMTGMLLTFFSIIFCAIRLLWISFN